MLFRKMRYFWSFMISSISICNSGHAGPTFKDVSDLLQNPTGYLLASEIETLTSNFLRPLPEVRGLGVITSHDRHLSAFTLNMYFGDVPGRVTNFTNISHSRTSRSLSSTVTTDANRLCTQTNLPA